MKYFHREIKIDKLAQWSEVVYDGRLDRLGKTEQGSFQIDTREPNDQWISFVNWKSSE